MHSFHIDHCLLFYYMVFFTFPPNLLASEAIAFWKVAWEVRMSHQSEFFFFTIVFYWNWDFTNCTPFHVVRSWRLLRVVMWLSVGRGEAKKKLRFHPECSAILLHVWNCLFLNGDIPNIQYQGHGFSLYFYVSNK